MDFSKLSRGELVAVAGGLLLLISNFLKSYEARPENQFANIDGKTGTLSFVEVHDITGILMIAAGLAPLILAYIIIRDHKLSWPRGQVTMIVAIAAFGLLFYHGIIDRPGEPSSEIELEIGWYGMLLGALMMLVGSVMRQTETEQVRKPPGVI